MENMQHALSNMQALHHAAERLLVTCSHSDKVNLIMDSLQECLAWDRGWLGSKPSYIPLGTSDPRFAISKLETRPDGRLQLRSTPKGI